jgi:hypothetical protein
MFSRWIMFIPLNTLFHQGERQNAEREACGKNGRAIFDSSTLAQGGIMDDVANYWALCS